MAARKDIPTFGLMQGVRVAHASMSVAGPFAAALMADMGADVIWVENPKGLDIARGGGTNAGWTVELNRRNQRNLSLNIPSPEGREVFLKLMAETDIFIEASKGGQYEKWGLSDEVLWEVNPKLVIVHISGYGQTGDPDYVGRASYDPIGQAFGGIMYMNGEEGMPAFSVKSDVVDYYSGFLAATTALAAYQNAQKTGRGDSVDVAQYEAALRTLGTFPAYTWNEGLPFKRQLTGTPAGVAGYDAYRCRDGKEVYILVLGPGVAKAALQVLGLEYGSEEFPAGSARFQKGTPGGDRLEAAVRELCASHDAADVERIFAAAKVPCSTILDFDDMLVNPQYLARESITKWPSERVGREVTGFNIFPKMKNFPGQIWRGGPNHGMDNRDILRDLGYSEAQIDALYHHEVVAEKADRIVAVAKEGKSS